MRPHDDQGNKLEIGPELDEVAKSLGQVQLLALLAGGAKIARGDGGEVSITVVLGVPPLPPPRKTIEITIRVDPNPERIAREPVPRGR